MLLTRQTFRRAISIIQPKNALVVSRNKKQFKTNDRWEGTPNDLLI